VMPQQMRSTCFNSRLMPNPPKVALLIDTSFIYGRGVLTGIADYLRSHRQWSTFVVHDELWVHPPDWLASSCWDGILSRFGGPHLARSFQRMNVPVVDMNDFHENPEFPWIGSDHRAIGGAAAAHFMERGFRHFGFCGISGELWSLERRKGFQIAVESSGFPVQVNESPRNVACGDDVFDQLVRWVTEFPKPVAIMTCNDIMGLHVINACHQASLMVPEEVAVIGVDNEELVCNFGDPPLSSVEPDAWQIGYRAAELLDALMAGKPAQRRRTTIDPVRVVTRQSTDILGVTDRLVASAARFIREHALRGCSVVDVLEHFRVSRSTLESRFRKSLNRSMKEEILRVQLDRIQQLLEETDYTLEHIASLTGFEYPETMSVLFKRKLGETPGEYRKRSTARGPRPAANRNPATPAGCHP